MKTITVTVEDLNRALVALQIYDKGIGYGERCLLAQSLHNNGMPLARVGFRHVYENGGLNEPARWKLDDTGNNLRRSFDSGQYDAIRAQLPITVNLTPIEVLQESV